MKKNVWYIICLVWALPLWNMQAQVAIGKEVKGVYAGASLELVSNAVSKGGLLLPKVSLTSASVWQPLKGVATEGMVVFNTHNTTANNLSGVGAYVWMDNRWIPFGSPTMSCTEAPSKPQVISLTKGIPETNEPFVAYVSPVPGATSYEWTLSDNLIGSSTTNFITLVSVATSSHTIQVRAKNDCGVSDPESKRIVVINSAPDMDNNGLIQGPTCYDVAMTESVACGDFIERRQAFPDSNPSLRTRAYVFTLKDNTDISDLIPTVVGDADGIIKSVGGAKTGQLSKKETFSVTFSDDINNIVERTHKSTATLQVVFMKGGIYYYTELIITVQDCSCCPLDLAFILADAAYEGIDELDAQVRNTLAAYLPELQRVYKPIPNAALCVYKTNLPSLKSTWENAMQQCEELDNRSGWRLPNIMELANHLHGRFHGYDLMSTVSPTRYFSSSEIPGLRNTSVESYYTGDYFIFYLSKGMLIKDMRIRCVKTINY
ncbi:MAG: hypothetical protein LBU22_13180 [Dysgonamonadaceae bacterium]|jgi:hypothetical protein|nr:hypothetical protein [Dysgonamonadaceae bacterium]